MKSSQIALLAVMVSAIAGASFAEGPKKDGVVSKDEFLKRAEKTFQEGDADSDGKLSPEERKALHEKRKERREGRREERRENREERREERQESKGQPH